jgi:hypothetical protein
MFNSKAEGALNAFLGGLILIAVVAILVKKGNATSSVLNSAGAAVGSSLYAAEGSPQPPKV